MHVVATVRFVPKEKTARFVNYKMERKKNSHSNIEIARSTVHKFEYDLESQVHITHHPDLGVGEAAVTVCKYSVTKGKRISIKRKRQAVD